MGLNKNNSIISYALISAKFESNKGKNIILTLIPLIEYLLITIYEKTVTTEELSKAFSEMYGYKIPLAVIDELLKILDKNKKIEKLKNEEYLIIKENIEEYDEIENYNKKLRTLIMDVDYFLKKRGKNIPSSEITNELFIFIIKNAIDFNDFILRNSNFEDLDSDNTNVQDELIEFLIEERKNDTPNYKFLNEIYYDTLPSVAALNQIVLKTSLRDIYKHETEIELFEASKRLLKEKVPLLSFMITPIIDAQIKARTRDIEECYEIFRKAKEYLISPKDWLRVVSYDKLDYTVPIAYQGMVGLVTGMNGELINDNYNHKKAIILNIFTWQFSLLKRLQR